MSGAEIDFTITWLESAERPERPRPHPPAIGLSLLRAQKPPVRFFRYLYDVVGRDYEWTDLHSASDEDLRAFAQDEQVGLYVAYLTGWPAGFIMLDRRNLPERAPGVCNIAYFGLAPEAMGRGMGDWLLGTGVHMAWDDGPSRLTVNTCSLDHPRALPLYQRWGFAPVRRETRRRKIVRG